MAEPTALQPRKRGRPRKYPLPTPVIIEPLTIPEIPCPVLAKPPAEEFPVVIDKAVKETDDGSIGNSFLSVLT
jgi:hypothetical protein